jgi:AraC-like DNA-binding protein
MTAEPDPIGVFGRALDALGRETGRSARQLAKEAHCSHTTLSRAMAGESLPSWEIVKAFVEACGGDEGHWKRQWEEARRAKASPRALTVPGSGTTSGYGPPDPQGINDVKAFVLGLRELKAYAGDPPLRSIARNAHASASTVHGVFRLDRSNLPSWELLDTIIAALGVSTERDRTEWRWAWARVNARKPFVTEDLAIDPNPLLQQMGHVGLEGIYATREEALTQFIGYVQYEIRPGGRLWIVGSSMKGLLQIPDRLHGADSIGAAVKKGCDVKILCTHPSRVDERAEQEGRAYGSINGELGINISDLRYSGLTSENLRWCRAAPTVFGICTSDRMLLNPYPYGLEAFRSLSMIFRRSPGSDERIFEHYEEAHFKKAWERGVTLDLDEWRRYDPMQARGISP